MENQDDDCFEDLVQIDNGTYGNTTFLYTHRRGLHGKIGEGIRVRNKQILSREFVASSDRARRMDELRNNQVDPEGS